jgi:hypothetical protein
MELYRDAFKLRIGAERKSEAWVLFVLACHKIA